MATNEKRTEISEIGEFGLIDRISKKFQLKNPSSIVGIGDDAAVIDTGNYYTIVTSDMLTEGVHFNLTYTPLNHLGYKAVAVNISDIAAMNATPQQITVNVALSNRFAVEAVDAIYDGIAYACDNYKVDLVGGDTGSSQGGLVISVTAIGKVAKDKVVKRGGAQKGDIICVTGDLGAAFTGLQVLEREKQEFLANPSMQPQLDQYEYIVKRQLKPEARMDIIYELADLPIVPTSMIDISDGLASEIFHLNEHSGMGFQVFENKIPVHKMTSETAEEFSLEPLTCALNGGEDYELLFTIKEEEAEKIKNHEDIHMIGNVVDPSEGCNLITNNEKKYPLRAQGWSHFRKEK